MPFLYIADPYLPDTDVWKDVIKVDSIEDINLAIATLENKIKEIRNEILMKQKNFVVW